MHTILVINPGSTSTKTAVFEDDKRVLQETIGHSAADLQGFSNITDQYDFRKQTVLDLLHAHGLAQADFSAVIGAQ